MSYNYTNIKPPQDQPRPGFYLCVTCMHITRQTLKKNNINQQKHELQAKIELQTEAWETEPTAVKHSSTKMSQSCEGNSQLQEQKKEETPVLCTLWPLQENVGK